MIASSCHSDLKQKIYRSGDIVTDADFHAGHAEKFESDGFLREFNEVDESAHLLQKLGHDLPNITLPPADNTVTDEGTKEPEGDGEGETGSTPPPGGEVPDYEAMTNKELKALLDEKEVEYNNKANKKTLIELLTAAG